VHLERGGVNEQARPDEAVVLLVLAQDVADVLAQKALDALTKLLDPLDVLLRDPPGAVRGVTRSRTSGNAFIGSTTTVSPGGRSPQRVMHIRLGTPLISAEQDPHLPALQFHLTARSGHCSAWI
jgi:hypothetical protein